MIEHYAAQYAAEGGPAVTLPTIPENHVPDAAMALVMPEPGRWVLCDGMGHVYAESDNPGDLAEWMSEFMDVLGDAVSRGDL